MELEKLPDGRAVEPVTITKDGLTATLLPYGARLHDLRLDGVPFQLVLGAGGIEPYLGDMAYFGATVGRFANRIGGASFEIEGETFETEANQDGRHTLHSGTTGTHAQLWEIAERSADAVTFALTLPDGQGGFPGTLDVSVRYALSDGALSIVTEAKTDRATPCSFAHHSYFRVHEGDVRDAQLRIGADDYLPVDEDLIPTGEEPVEGTPFDFRAARVIGHHGYDHNFCLNRRGEGLRDVAELRAPDDSLTLTVRTDAPGLQVYDASSIPGATAPDGSAWAPNAGIALETQEWPDAPNQPGFPDCILWPGETYRHAVVYAFSR